MITLLVPNTKIDSWGVYVRFTRSDLFGLGEGYLLPAYPSGFQSFPGAAFGGVDGSKTTRLPPPQPLYGWSGLPPALPIGSWTLISRSIVASLPAIFSPIVNVFLLRISTFFSIFLYGFPSCNRGDILSSLALFEISDKLLPFCQS
jgi:hypothetical protein